MGQNAGCNMHVCYISIYKTKPSYIPTATYI